MVRRSEEENKEVDALEGRIYYWCTSSSTEDWTCDRRSKARADGKLVNSKAGGQGELGAGKREGWRREFEGKKQTEFRIKLNLN